MKHKQKNTDSEYLCGLHHITLTRKDGHNVELTTEHTITQKVVDAIAAHVIRVESTFIVPKATLKYYPRR